MENPHAERQNVILQRIIKNTVRSFPLAPSGLSDVPMGRQDKCTETLVELNHFDT